MYEGGKSLGGTLSLFAKVAIKILQKLSVDPGVLAQVFSVPDRFVVMKV